MTGPTLFARHRLAGLALGALGVALAAVPAMAQDDYSGHYDRNGTYTTEELNVYAPRRERSAIGAPIETVTASRVVDYSDLNLDSPGDAHLLKVRIERAARSACDELDADYPDTGLNMINIDDGPGCYSRAVRDAMSRVP